MQVAFSGSDLTRALWLGLVGSLFCTPSFQPFRATLLIFLIDRAWPYVAMGFAGYDMAEIAASLVYAVHSLPRDAVYLLVRFSGLLALCAVGYHLRLAIHGRVKQSGGLPVPY